MSGGSGEGVDVDARATLPSTERRARAYRSLWLIAVAAVAMLAADYAVSALLLLALFGIPALIVGIPIAAVVLAAVLIALSRSLTGRRNVVGSIAVTILLAGVGAYGFANGVLSFVGRQTDLALHLLVCGLCALALGVFLGPWPLRIAGTVAAIAVIALVSSIPTSAELAEGQRAELEAQQRQESIDWFLDHGARPVLTDREGWSNPRIHPTGASAMTWARSSTGAVATILVQANVEEPLDGDWCHFISRGGDGGPATPGALPEWCIPTDMGWARADGTGIVLHDDGRLIAINAAGEIDAAQAGGTPAAAEDITALHGSLRPMSTAEIEQHVLPVYDAGLTPVIETPGL